MSKYLTRIIEIKVKDFSARFNEDEFGDGSYKDKIRVGSYFTVVSKSKTEYGDMTRHIYYRLTDDGPVEVKYNDVPVVWRLFRLEDNETYRYCEFIHGKRVITGFCNNGGLLRDSFFSPYFSMWGIDTKGLPADISPETSEMLSNDESYKFAHSHSYVTLKEMDDLLSTVRLKMVSDLSDRIMETQLSHLTKMVGKLVDNYNKDDDKKKKIKKPDERKSVTNVVSEYLGGDYGNYFDEYVSLSNEIDTIANIVDLLSVSPSWEDIRVIYYIE